MVMFALLILGAGVVVYALGGWSGLGLKKSIALGGLALLGAFGALCLKLAVWPDEGATRKVRIGYFIRGVGILAMATAGAIPAFTTVANYSVLAWLFGVGMALYFFSIFFS